MDSRSAAVPAPVRVEHAVAYSLATTGRAEDVYPAILAAIGGALGWDLGAVWEIAQPAGEELCCVEVWRAPGVAAGAFVALSRETRLAPGVGLPGRVWASEDPCWILDVTDDPNFPRA